MMTNEEINRIVKEAEDDLLNSKRYNFSFKRNWANQFSDAAGIYALFDKNKMVYIGESGSVRKRLKDLRSTYNHTFRRTLGYRLFNFKATSEIKFPIEIEFELNRYFEKYITISTIDVSFGRLEIEEELANKYQSQLYNLKLKRK